MVGSGGEPEGGWLLALDLSGPRGILVLDGPGRTTHRLIEAGERTGGLFVEAGELMRETGIEPGGLGLLGVAVGPGSFTGVRTAVMAAKTMAEVLRVPLVATDSLSVLAAGMEEERWIFVAVDARRGEVYHALFRVADEGSGPLPEAAEWMEVGSPPEAAEALRGWMEKTGEEPVLAGTGIEAFPEAWPSRLTRRPSPWPQPGALARLCRRAFRRGEVADPILLTPMYLRRPDTGGKGSRGKGECG